MAVSEANRCTGSGDPVTQDSHKSAPGGRRVCRVCGRYLYVSRATRITLIPAHAKAGREKFLPTQEEAVAIVKAKHPDAAIKTVKRWASAPSAFVVYADPDKQPYPVESLSNRKKSADAAWLDAAERIKRAERIEQGTQPVRPLNRPKHTLNKNG